MNAKEYIDRLRANFERMDPEEREAILLEIRDYLEQESERLRNLSPGMDKGLALEQAVEGFAPVEHVAFIYDGDHEMMSVVNQETGERLLDVPMLSGRISGKVLATNARGIRATINYRKLSAWAAIGLAVVFIAAGTFFAAQDVELLGAEDDVLYTYGGATADPVTGAEAESFQSMVSSVAFSLQADVTAGCIHVEIIDPEGNVAHDSGAVCAGDSYAFDGDLDGAGWWTVQYTYDGFAGDFRVSATEA